MSKCRDCKDLPGFVRQHLASVLFFVRLQSTSKYFYEFSDEFGDWIYFVLIIIQLACVSSLSKVPLSQASYSASFHLLKVVQLWIEQGTIQMRCPHQVLETSGTAFVMLVMVSCFLAIRQLRIGGMPPWVLLFPWFPYMLILLWTDCRCFRTTWLVVSSYVCVQASFCLTQSLSQDLDAFLYLLTSFTSSDLNVVFDCLPEFSILPPLLCSALDSCAMDGRDLAECDACLS